MLLCLGGGVTAAQAAGLQDRPVALTHSVPPAQALRGARLMGSLPAAAPIRLAITLPLRDQAGLDSLLQRLYDPGDPQFHKYLTPAQFAARFGPTQADYEAVAAFARSKGLTITSRYTSRTVLDVAGPAWAVGAAFGVRLNRFQMPDGRVAYANTAAPQVPRALAGRIGGIVGLDNLVLRHHHHRVLSRAQPRASGSGPSGGMTPSDIKSAYNLNDVSLGGEGQVLGLYELDGYTAGDITTYQTQFNLQSLPVLQNVLLDGFNGNPSGNGGEAEVTLDIDMMLALAPKAAKILVYEAPNSGSGPLDLFVQMANDNLAKSMSTSWGLPELLVSTAERNAENDIFKQMAAQGQSIFDASGDNGAYDDAATLSVDDPASQPFMVGVGGTKLSLSGIGGTWTGETTWGNASDTSQSPKGAGGGGGISAVWAKPSYQTGLGSSPTMRDVPDVALNADPSTGYDIFVTDVTTGKGAWQTVGGTSAAAPLWAAFAALVNQRLASFGAQGGTLGFANPPIYKIGTGTSYTNVFHDIADGSTNLFYAAVTGYDDATGWGTFIGDKLLLVLAPNPEPGGPNGTLSITVEGTDGRLTNATITVVSAATGSIKGQTSTPDQNGVYSVSVPSAINYFVTADAPGYAGKTVSTTNAGQPITVPAGGTTTLDLGLLSVAHSFAAGKQMISSPFEYNGVADFPTLFGLTLPLQSSDPKLVAWSPSLGGYVFYPSFPADTLHLGQGYWINLTGGNYVHRQGTAASQTQPFRFNLQPGWNIIGDPFTTDMPLANVTVDTIPSGTPAALSASPLIRQPLYSYNTDAKRYDPLGASDSLHPWVGYWIFAKSPATLVYPVPTTPPPAPGTGR